MSLFFDNFDHRLQGQHCPSATLIYIVDGYYSGRKTTAIQLYLADLHCECRTEHSVLH